MFVAGISTYAAMVFSFLSFSVAIPSAVKVFNWTATLYKGAISFETPMLYAYGFIGLFLIGGLTGLFLATLGLDIHVHDTYFVVAHFHYIMVGGAIMGYLGGLHFWWPKMTGRMYSEFFSRIAAILVFVGFNLTFFPQFVLGYLGMPRRYHAYPDEFQVLNVMSSAGATVLGARLRAAGDLLPVVAEVRARSPARIRGARRASSGRRSRRRRPRTSPRRRRASASPTNTSTSSPRRRILSNAVAHADGHGHAPRAPSGAAAPLRHDGAAEGSCRHRHVGVPAHRNPVLRRAVHGLHDLPRLVLRRVRRSQPIARALLWGGLNTAVLIGSSLTMAMAVRARADQQAHSHRQLADPDDDPRLRVPRRQGHRVRRQVRAPSRARPRLRVGA